MLILIAPGETEAETHELWIGDTSSKLTRKGIEDAKAINKLDADRVYVAAQDHIEEFAKIVLVKPEYVRMPALVDRSLGTLTGRKYRETMAEFPRRNWLGWFREYDVAPPEGQSLQDITSRVLDGLSEKVLPVKSTERVVIVAALDVLRIIIGRIQKRTPEDTVRMPMISCLPYTVNGDLPEQLA